MHRLLIDPAGRHRSPLRRLARADQQAHPRHPPAPGQAGHTIQPSPHRLANLGDLYGLAAATDIVIPSEIKTAC
jgi:hypothetical protein